MCDLQLLTVFWLSHIYPFNIDNFYIKYICYTLFIITLLNNVLLDFYDLFIILIACDALKFQKDEMNFY
jgi:hypothetical protein